MNTKIDTDVFFVDRANKTVIWIYYNPDSYAGGQFVTNEITFDNILQIAVECDGFSDFFDRFGSLACQTLADVGTEWFEDAEAEFHKTPDFTGCTKESMHNLVLCALE